MIRGWSEGSKKPEREGGGVNTQHLGQHPGQVEDSVPPPRTSSSWWPEFGQSASKGPGDAMQGPACSRIQGGSEIKGQVCDLSGVFPSLHAHVH